MASTAPRVIPIPLQPRANRRNEGRLEAAMPVRVDGRETTTQNLSADGIAFESEESCAIGSRIRVDIEYLLDGHQYPLSCEAEVVRVEPRGDRWLVAAKLLLDPLPPAAEIGEQSATGAPP
jgi:hypothetical protein